MISFILNNKLINTDVPKGMSLLNFIRNKAGLKGTKGGCKEGDCGACTVLAGELKNGEVVYKTIVSCLTPIGNVQGKHIVTIEGLNNKTLTPVQKEIVDNAATQCGFCTPGFVVSLTGYALSKNAGNKEDAIASVAGNICRCTGYKSIEKTALVIADLLKSRGSNNSFSWLIENNFIPEYFSEIKGRLENIQPDSEVNTHPDIFIGGGTDLMVQMPEIIKDSALKTIAGEDYLKKIEKDDNKLIIGGAVAINDLLENHYFRSYFPKLNAWFKLISSEQIRNTATISGNFVNASPIGDMSIFFLALEAKIRLTNSSNEKRSLLLKDFFVDYKKLNKGNDEIITSIEFEILGKNTFYNFEKVSKRLHLDIASVNSAIKLEMEDNIIKKAVLTAGGVAPVPKFLENTSTFLSGKKLSQELIKEAVGILEKDIKPIDDVRGSIKYKKLLLRQIILSHFIELFPEMFKEEMILQFI